MSRLMETYDPNWQARWQRAYDQLQALKAQDGDGWIGDEEQARRTPIVEALTKEMFAALDAQFRTVMDYAAFLWKPLNEAMTFAGKDIPWPSFTEHTAMEEVRAAYQKANGMLTRLKTLDLIEDPFEWSSGVFCEPPWPGEKQRVIDREFAFERDVTLKARLVIETKLAGIHCCAIDAPNPRFSVKSRAVEIANVLAPELRAQWRRDRRYSLRRYFVPPPITFYFYAPQVFWDLPGDHVFQVTFKSSGGKLHTPTWQGMSSIPPLLHKLALGQDPEFRDLVASQPPGGRATDLMANGRL